MSWLVAHVLIDVVVLVLWTWWLARALRRKAIELSDIQLEWEQVLAVWQTKAAELEKRLAEDGDGRGPYPMT